MPSDALPPAQPAAAPWKPANVNRVALVLQGGGALGAYQAGAYQALHEAGLEPDWINGVSIGAINGAIIAGNKPGDRLDRLHAFWNTVTSRPDFPFIPPGDDARRWFSTLASGVTIALGTPGMFDPNIPNPWFSPPGSPTATSFYDSAPLRETLLRLVDFKELNRDGGVRYAAGAVSVVDGNFAYFDSGKQTIEPEHVMASGALPPGLPMVRVGTDYFWDGGLVSNTPLQHFLDNIGGLNAIVFQIDLFSARGPLPRDMLGVMSRQKDIIYSSRTRLVTDYYSAQYKRDALIRDLLGKIPDAELTSEQLALKKANAALPSVTILELIYQQMAFETQGRDYEFSAATMREHWNAGYKDTRRTLDHRDWLEVHPDVSGIVSHDIHRFE